MTGLPLFSTAQQQVATWVIQDNELPLDIREIAIFQKWPPKNGIDETISAILRVNCRGS
jgi:hypothetical protein